MTLVCAGAGSSKTTSVAAWAASTSLRVAWLGLDETDNDPATFWHDVLSALRVVDVLDEGTGLADVVPASTFGLRDVRRITMGLGTLAEPVVLVLDDLHEVSEPRVLAGLDRFVADLPQALRLVLVSRHEPAIRTQRLRLSGALTDVDGRELAFDASEAGRMFDQQGLRLTDGQRDLLVKRTEGWAAGLRLAALSVTSSDVDVAEAVDDFAGDDRSVGDYLLNEVLVHQPREARRLLLGTSVLDRVCGPLADALTGRDDGQTVLEGLARANALVVALDQRMTWFRYHPLLRDLLQHERAADRSLDRRDLEQRAASWFRDQGHVVEATQHLCAAEDWAGARRLLVEHALPLLLSSRRAALAASLRPATTPSDGDPPFDRLLLSAAVRFVDRDYLGMSRDAQAAARRLHEVDPSERDSAELVLHLVEMAASRIAGESRRTVALAEQVIDSMAAGTAVSVLPASRHYEVMARGNLGSALVWLGGFDQAPVHLERARSEAARLDLELPWLNASAHISVLEAMQGRLGSAESTAAEVVSLAVRRGWEREPQVLGAYLALGVVGLLRDELTHSEEQLRRGLEGSREGMDPALRRAIQVALVRVSLARGNLVAARLGCAQLRSALAADGLSPGLTDWLASAERELMLRDGDPARLLERTLGSTTASTRMHRARAHLALGQRPEAAELVAGLLEDEPADSVLATQAWAVRAVLADAVRDDVGAVDALGRALARAEVEQLRRPLRDLGAPVAALLHRHREVLADQAWLAGQGMADLPEPLSEPLTDRERAVLTYLPTMMTNEEIGAALFVSVNTVKAHIKAIYRKLGVTARRAAVQRARDLELLT